MSCSNHLSEKVLEKLPFPVALMDKELKYVFVNSHYKELLKKPSESIVGLHAQQVVPKETYETALPYYKKALSGEKCKFIALGSENLSVKKMQVNYLPDPESGGFLAVFDPESIQNRYFKMGVDSAIATLNHYINNSLSVISGKVSRIERREVSQEVLDDLKSIKASMNRIDRILKSLTNSDQLSLDYYLNSEGTYFKIDE